MVAPEGRERRDRGLTALAAVAALAAASLAGGETARLAVVRAMADRSLAELAIVAGLTDERGTPLRDEPFPVFVVQEGGAGFVRAAVIEAIDASGSFVAAESPHLLRVEPVEAPEAIALQLRLSRQGWDLRAPGLARRRIVPWAPVLAAVGGAVSAVVTRRVAASLCLAGLAAQLLLLALPWPAALIPPRAWAVEVAEGPLFAGVRDLVRGSPAWVPALAIALVVFSLVLVGFDHRRSRGVAGEISLPAVGGTALLAALGAASWVEAAARAGLWAAAWGPAGAAAVAALVVAWIPALRRVGAPRRP